MKRIVSGVVIAGAVTMGAGAGYGIVEAVTDTPPEVESAIHAAEFRAHEAGAKITSLAEDDSCEQHALATQVLSNHKNFPTDSAWLSTLLGNVCVYGDVTVHETIATEAIPLFDEAKGLREELHHVSQTAPKTSGDSSLGIGAGAVVGFVIGAGIAGVRINREEYLL